MDLSKSRIYCTLHQKDSIDIDTKTFRIICTKCDSAQGNLKVVEKNQEDELNYCEKHKNEQKNFYCQDCFVFICSNCFVLEHRNHKSSTVNLVSKTLVNSLESLVSELENLKKIGEENKEEIEKPNVFFKSKKTDFVKYMNQISEGIFKYLTGKVREFELDLEVVYLSFYNEVSNSLQRLEINKLKFNKILEEVQKHSKDISKLSNTDVCVYKKTHDKTLNENEKYVRDLQGLLKNSIPLTMQKSENEFENLSKRISKIQKNIGIYENSVINTIQSGIPNICMRIRRFHKLFFRGTQYFKSTSVCMTTSQTINLVGFGLCGLFQSQNSINDINLEIKIFELDDIKGFHSNSLTISKLTLKLPVILCNVDPIYQVYLKNGVTINKSKYYFIVIDNLSNNKYVDLWKGEVKTEKENLIENKNTIECNNTLVKFEFTPAQGVESDLNEFTAGIINDVVFSYSE